MYLFMERSGERKISRRKFFGKGILASCFGYTLAVDATNLFANGESAAGGGAKISAKGANPIPRPKRRKDSLLSTPIEGEPVMEKVAISCDVLVAGGGLSGICAALSAAREGAKVVLIEDRSHLGGNASSEIRMHPLGIKADKTGWREGGIIEELLLENIARNPEFSWGSWDLLLYEKCVGEKNITLLLDTTLVSAETNEEASISKAIARCDYSFTIYEICAQTYVDATGDARLAMEAGAAVMSGREGKAKFGESRADFDILGSRQGASLMFSSVECDRPVPFVAPKWAVKIKPEHLKHRPLNAGNLNFGYWWIETGGRWDVNRDLEQTRHELLAIILGVWDYVKNSGKFPSAKNRVIDFVGFIPGKRDTYRVVGEHILTQQDIESGCKAYDDGVCVGGWQLGDHPSGGFWSPPGYVAHYAKTSDVSPYNIPLGCYISRDVPNLMMAGRDISCSHVAFGSTRIMLTCAVGGQAVGATAAMCAENAITPAQLRADKALMGKLKQRLLRSGQTILGVKNTDENDLARTAKVTASSYALNSRPENVISGIQFDNLGENKNRWLAEVSSKPWIKLEFDEIKEVSSVRFNFDSGTRRIDQTSSLYDIKKFMIRGPQPELVKDFDLTAITPDGNQVKLAQVRGNYLRNVICKFAPIQVKAIRADILATNGDKYARIYEIRAEA